MFFLMPPRDSDYIRLMDCKDLSFPPLKVMYQGFKQVCPSGLVDENTFRDIYAQFFPQGGRFDTYEVILRPFLTVSGHVFGPDSSNEVLSSIREGSVLSQAGDIQCGLPV